MTETRTEEIRQGRTPRTAAVTFEEGGDWILFEHGVNQGPQRTSENGRPSGNIHSIRFEDGSEWDAVNGWRY